MFNAYNKNTGELTEILAVNRNGNKTEFLVWRNYDWIWLNADLFERV